MKIHGFYPWIIIEMCKVITKKPDGIYDLDRLKEIKVLKANQITLKLKNANKN